MPEVDKSLCRFKPLDRVRHKLLGYTGKVVHVGTMNPNTLEFLLKFSYESGQGAEEVMNVWEMNLEGYEIECP